MKKITLIISVIAFIVACGNKDKSVKKDEVVTKTAILVDDFEEFRNNANTDITSVSIDENIMTLGVSYSGGCEEHEFSLIGSRLISKSLPPQRGIMLYHNNNGDNCRELKTEELKFDIKALEYKHQEEIMLILEGWKDKISFTSY